jgi:hypothetical protein
LLARAKTWMSFSHYLLSVIHCPLTFHILIIFSSTTWPNWIKVVYLEWFTRSKYTFFEGRHPITNWIKFGFIPSSGSHEEDFQYYNHS